MIGIYSKSLVTAIGKGIYSKSLATAIGKVLLMQFR